MGININSPLPSSLASECRKAARILNDFTDNGKGVDIIIPPHILSGARGLAIFTVLKAGFLFSGRAGSGLVVAKLPDGSWSAPSAIMTGGMGFGGQVGAELTDFIMVLNTTAAVKTFMHHGSITLGGNISVAAGPIGRNAEASGTASIKNVSAVYSYSKTRGLFAGVSLEGSVIVERFDANKKMYGHKVKCRDLLNGTIPPPPTADALYQALEIKTGTAGHMNARFGHMDNYSSDNSAYHYPYSRNNRSDDSSSYNREYEERIGNSLDSSSGGLSFSRGAVHNMAKTGLSPNVSSGVTYGNRARGSSVGSWRNESSSYDSPGRITSKLSPGFHHAFNSDNSSRALVTAPKKDLSKDLRARALYNFKGEQNGDLPFNKDDIIIIVSKSNTQNDWWTGKLNGKQGIFPANFVQIL